MNRFNPIRPEHGGDSPDILRLAQPMPISARVCRFLASGQWITTLVRFWKPEEIARCRLCPKGRCTARDNVCMLMVNKYVSDDDALLFSTVGMTRQRDRGIRHEEGGRL